MKGSLCGAGRPLAKDKTTVCPPSLARGWGLPLGWPAGWGWAQVCSLFPFSIFPVSITELLPWPRPPPSPQRGPEAPAVGIEVVSSLALEACKRMQEGGGDAREGPCLEDSPSSRVAPPVAMRVLGPLHREDH